MWNVNKNLLYTQLLVTPWDMDSLLFEVVCVCFSAANCQQDFWFKNVTCGYYG